MATASQPTSVQSSTSGPGSNPGRVAAVGKFARWAGATLALAMLGAFGFFDPSIRSDPFTDRPALWEWLSKPQPDPRLAIIPVLPMGRAGVLSWRPKSTQWIAEKSISEPASPTPRSAAEVFGLGNAHAAEPEKVRPKSDGFGGADLSPSKIAPPSPPLNVQQTRPPESKAAPPQPLALPKPPTVTLVPNPVSEAKFGQLSPRAPLPADAYWAGCDMTGAFCASVQGREYVLSSNGGQNWIADVRRRNENPPLLVLGDKRNLLFSDVGPAASQAAATSAVPNPVDTQFPFALAEYGIGNQTRGFRISTLDEAMDQVARAYLRLTGAADRLNFFAVLPRGSEASGTGDTGYRMFALFSNGQMLRTDLKLSDRIPGQISHATTFRDLQTRANLRSLHFQPDQRIGWISSGWNDGNEEGIYPAIFETTNAGADWERLRYRASPAPWVFFLAMPGLMIAFVAAGLAWRDIPKDEPRRGIADVGTSDSPIGWNDRDVLGLKPLALSLSRFVRNTSTAPPLTIAITGEWGTGKSSLMNLVAEDLRDRGANTVWFNAWHHQKEENILAALLENIREQAIPSAWRLSGLMFRLRLLRTRMGKNLPPLFLAIAGIATLYYVIDWHALSTPLSDWLEAHQGKAVETGQRTWLEFVQDWSNHALGVGVTTLALLIFKIYGTLNLKPSELMATLRNNAKLADFSAQLGFRYKFAIEFNAAGQALRTATNPGLVIFIDDLDRCSPANLMEVLESINFLTTAGPCFILLGMDEPKIVEIVARHYSKKGRDTDRARQYLKKLINLTVPVPEVNETNSIDLSSGADPTLVPASQWPKRIRGALRSIPDACIPALVLIAAIWLAVSEMPTKVLTNEPATIAQQETPKPAGTTDGAGATATPAPSRNDTVVPVTKIPTVTADQLERRTQIQLYIGVGLTGLILLLLIARRVTTLREDRVEDSDTFRTALTIWHPAVFAADPTPRGVKRHQNRLRLQAMRLRPLHEKPGLLDSWFSTTAGAEATDPGKPDISEPKLVALGGIAALFRDIPDWTTDDNKSMETAGNDDLAKRAAIIQRCRSHFKTAFSGDWPPGPADVDAFKKLRESL